MELYEHKKIEAKWREKWDIAGVYKTSEDTEKEKFYILDMFPYPSGAGLHVGHPKGYIATDIISRYKKMKGFNVLHPMGWDAFGLPAEQYALKNKVHPRVATQENIATFKKQIEKISLNYDWDREFSTTDPEYYKWTQWTFLQMFKKGLVDRSHEPINWCPSCKTGLANEDLENGACERCDTPIEKKKMPQWVVKITDYADRMLADLDQLDWQENIKQSQRNWIGRSNGAQITFELRYSQNSAEETQNDAEDEQTQDATDVDNYFLYKELTYKIRGALCNVRKKVGLGHKESVYHNALKIEFEKQRIPFESEKQIDIMYDGKKIGVYQPDLIIDGKILIELKALPKIGKQQRNQVWTYLKGSDYKLALLVNYSPSDLEIERKIYDTARESAHEGMDSALSASSQHNSATSIEVFTTRPDTLYGCTYLVFAPEHDLIEQLKGQIENLEEVNKYQKETQKKTEIERTAEGKEKTGVKLEGVSAINPVNGEEIPVFVADYVLAGYGTGAIMAVPAHDQRDFEFAKKYDLAIKQVIAPYVVVTGLDAPRSDKNIVEFEAATAIIRHWEKDLYYVVQFRDGLEGLVGGHVEEGESAKDAIVREVREESGYQTPIIDEILFEHAYSRGYKSRKKREELCHEAVYVVSLKDNTRKAIEDHETTEGSWMNVEKILNNDNFLSHHKKMFRQYSEKTTFSDMGVLVNSGEFNGMKSEEAMKKITEKAEGKMTVTYKLRDWVFGRQRYWGEPIPLIHCEKCGVVAVPEEELPLKLPEVEKYEPTDTGESPLAGIAEWVNTTCPECGGPAKRETDTMPQWAGSSWYYLRYIDPQNDNALVDPEKEKYWSPVDFYVGGAEHATRHLIYARFWHKFLFDIGVVSYEEPFTKLQTVGLITAEDGRKMSKRWGNVVNPDDVIERFGADTFRTYEMFMGPFDASVAWSTEGMIGPRKFLERIWKIYYRDYVGTATSASLKKTLHKTIKKVGDDIEEMKYNTAIAAMMILANQIEKAQSLSSDAKSKKCISIEDFGAFLKILSPFAPHMTQELWEQMGYDSFLIEEAWPLYDEKYLVDDEIELIIQVNGKLRDKIVVSSAITEDDAKERALASEKVQKFINGKEVRKVIFVQGKLVSIVV